MARTKVRTLSKSDQRVIREDHYAVSRHPFKEFYCCDEDFGPEHAPEMVVAKIPYDGIPAQLKFVGNYTAGKVQCELFYLDATSNLDPAVVGGTPQIFPMLDSDGATPIKEWVYNTYNWKAYGQTFAGNHNMYLRVQRDREGRWLCEKPQQLLKCKPTVDIAPGGNDQVAIWMDGNDTGQTEYAYNNWKNSGTRIAFANTEQWIFFCPDEGSSGQWVFVFDNPLQQQTGIPFYNNSGANITPYSVNWAIDETTIGGSTYVVANKIGTTFDFFWLVNRNATVPNTDTGTGDWFFDKSGPVAVDISFTGGSGHEIGPKPGSNVLWPDYRGFMTLCAPYTLNGVRVVDCIQKHVLRAYGRLYNTLTQNADGTGTAQFEFWNRKGSDKKRFYTGWDKVDVYAPLMNKGDVAKTGTFAFVDWGSDMWEADPTCDPDNTNSTQGGTGGSSASNQFVVEQGGSQFSSQGLGF